MVLCDLLGEFGLECSTQFDLSMFLLMKLVSSALPNVLMSGHHTFWKIRTYNIFEIVDNIVSGIFMLFDPYINLRLEKVSI
jgi:hypothetical protein